MKEYTVASLAVLLAAGGVAWLRGLLRCRSLWLGMGAFAVLTIVADVVITQIGVYRYDGRFNSGLAIGRMPLEDLAYGIALYLTAVTVWSWEARDAR